MADAVCIEAGRKDDDIELVQRAIIGSDTVRFYARNSLRHQMRMWLLDRMIERVRHH